MVPTCGKIAKRGKSEQQAMSSPLCRHAPRLHRLAQETCANKLNGVGQTNNVSPDRTDRVLRQRTPDPEADMGETTILEVRESPILPTPMEIDYAKRQTRAPSEATMRGSGNVNVGQDMGPCGHHPAKGKLVAVDCVLPTGVQIDCAECLQNFKKQTDVLFAIFQLTFEEQDLERAAHSTAKVDAEQGLGIAIDRGTLQEELSAGLPVRETPPPIQSSSKPTTIAKKKGKSVRGRLRSNGRFLPGPRLAFDLQINPESRIAEDGTEEPQPSAEAGVEKTSPEESIYVSDNTVHVEAPGASGPPTDSRPTHKHVTPAPLVTALSPCGDEDNQGSTIHVSNGTTAISQDPGTNYVTSHPTLALQGRDPRKRGLTEKARELLATGDAVDPESFYTGPSKQVGKQASTVPADIGDATQQPSVNSGSTNQNIASCPMEPPSSKRKGYPYHEQPPTKRQKTPDIMSSQPPVVKRGPGRPRKPRPSADVPPRIVIGTSVTTPDEEGSASSRSVTTRSASTGSFQQSPTSPIYGPEFRLAYSSTAKLPAIPIAPALRLEVSPPVPEKRRRGRPPKVTVEKPIPIAPVPIQPKPVAIGDTIPVPDAFSVVGYSTQVTAPSQPKKRGRPRKPQITLSRSPVVAPMPYPNAPTGGSFGFTSASLPPSTIQASPSAETVGPTRMMPFSPQKRQINLIIRDSTKALHTPGNAPTSGAAQVRGGSSDSGRFTTVNDVSKTAAPVTSSPLASVMSSLNHPLVTPRPASIADAVTNISTDSEPSSSSSSEDDTEEDETFHPNRSWVAVNTGSSAGAPKATSRGGGSVGTRGRGRRHESTPIGGGSTGVRSKSGAVKMEKGQQTLGSFFLRPGVPVDEPAMPAAGIDIVGPVAKRGGKRGTGASRVKIENEDEDVDVKMEDI